MFSGFLAFALLGPYVPEGFESNRLLKLFDRELDEEDEDGSKKSSKKSLGRRNSRQEEAQNVASNRRNQVANGSNTSVSTQRGLGWGNEVQVTQIALQGQLAEEREKDRRISALQFQINQVQQSIKTDIDLAKAIAPTDMEDPLWIDVLEGRKKVKEYFAQLVKMQREHENPSEQQQIFLRPQMLLSKLLVLRKHQAPMPAGLQISPNVRPIPPWR